MIATQDWQATRAAEPGRVAEQPPNILFIILDDVGIDQLGLFNPSLTYSNTTPADNRPWTPSIDAIANQGVNFSNLTTMPECSPSRATFFTGRYPFRTGVDAAILSEDLPAAQLSPFEITTPMVLREAGYQSAMFGKFHMAGPDNNPDGWTTPSVLGWDHFDGNLQGGPPFIDASVGGQYITDTLKYSCGYPVGETTGGCWLVDAANNAHYDDNGGTGYTGVSCLTQGGIPALRPDGTFGLPCTDCQEPPALMTGSGLTPYNGYYAWPRVVVDGTTAITNVERTYMSSFQVDAAIDWIAEREQASPADPWMATVSFDAIHTPYQAPPDSLWPAGYKWPSSTPMDCSSSAAVPYLSDLMLESMDIEIGRLLVETGLVTATGNPAEPLSYTPAGSDTMIVIVGDNGTYFPSVKSQYNWQRSKGTPYQTGVSAPLIVAGPLATKTGWITETVNSVDLFQLFAEIAGLDARAVVTASHILDSQPMLPLLTGTAPEPPRNNQAFTQVGSGVKANGTKLWPCVLSANNVHVCTDTLFTSENLCKAEGGIWYGPTTTTPTPVHPTCCSVKTARIYTNPPLQIVPIWAQGMRDADFKLVVQQIEPCPTQQAQPANEFFQLVPAPNSTTTPAPPPLDNHDLNGDKPLNPTAMAIQTVVVAERDALLASEMACPGDGNLDKVVNDADSTAVWTYINPPYNGVTSVYDFNRNATTEATDAAVVAQHLGTACPTPRLPGSRPPTRLYLPSCSVER